ncbi:MAG: hypothetical protein J6T92_06365 [Ottowia sp.]|nr:hypothetical protein [Ottowia sp.]
MATKAAVKKDTAARSRKAPPPVEAAPKKTRAKAPEKTPAAKPKETAAKTPATKPADKKGGRKPAREPKPTRREAQRRARASLDPRIKITANVFPTDPNPPNKKDKWRSEIPQQAREFALLGITDREMAGHFGVDETTFSRWKKMHPELAEALDGGRDGANAKVAASLYQRAVGFTETIQEIKLVMGEPQVVEYKRYFPPEVQAQIFWLKNRRPDLWRDKVENALVGAPDGEVTPRIVVEHIKSAMKEAERDAAPTK